MKKQFRIIRSNGLSTDWTDMKGWTIERISTFVKIMNIFVNDWQIEYRVVEE